MKQKIEFYKNGAVVFIEGNITSQFGNMSPDVAVGLEELPDVSKKDFRLALLDPDGHKTLRQTIVAKAKVKADAKRAQLQNKPAGDTIKTVERPLTNLEQAIADLDSNPM